MRVYPTAIISFFCINEPELILQRNGGSRGQRHVTRRGEKNMQTEVTYASELEARVMRKISFRIVPFIMLLYFIAFIDRVNIGFAALTMNKDLGFSPAVFGLGAGIFFLGYAAAVDQDVSTTAIGNAVASLENRLGVRLFNRTTRKVALTSAGREYVEAIAPALSDIRNAAQAVADHSRKPTGTPRFSCSLAGGRQPLMPFVFEYLRRYGEMKLEIVTEGRLIDIIEDGFDTGVRLAEAVPQDMIAVPLGPHTRHVVVAAPSYFANRSTSDGRWANKLPLKFSQSSSRSSQPAAHPGGFCFAPRR
jgi:Bacterial regulatory helix-turn-helix protein, lysR family/LysR substrate binding domain